MACVGQGQPRKPSSVRPPGRRDKKPAKEARLELATGGSWGLLRDHHYQLANRFAWSWKLALVGVPVVLVYHGFLNAQEMAPKDVPLRSEGDWTRALKDHTRGIVDERGRINESDRPRPCCGPRAPAPPPRPLGDDPFLRPPSRRTRSIASGVLLVCSPTVGGTSSSPPIHSS